MTQLTRWTGERVPQLIVVQFVLDIRFGPCAFADPLRLCGKRVLTTGSRRDAKDPQWRKGSWEPELRSHHVQRFFGRIRVTKFLVTRSGAKRRCTW